MSLLKSLCEHFVGQTVHLDVHLGRGDTVLGTCNLEVHVTEVVLVAEDVGEDGVAAVRILFIGDQTHCDTGYRLADLYACVHESEAAAADGSL